MSEQGHTCTIRNIAFNILCMGILLAMAVFMDYVEIRPPFGPSTRVERALDCRKRAFDGDSVRVWDTSLHVSLETVVQKVCPKVRNCDMEYMFQVCNFDEEHWNGKPLLENRRKTDPLDSAQAVA